MGGTFKISAPAIGNFLFIFRLKALFMSGRHTRFTRDDDPGTASARGNSDAVMKLISLLNQRLSETDYIEAERLIDQIVEEGETQRSTAPRQATDSRPLSAVREIQQIRFAESHVRPFVGAVDGASSVAAVYRTALRRMNVTFDGMENSAAALKVVFDLSRGAPPAIAMDQAQTEALEQRFPHINRLHTGGRVR
jgi:hypothetical protein